MYENLQPRIVKTFHDALTDESQSFTTQYGAILGKLLERHGSNRVGIMYMGPRAMELLLFPSIEENLERIQLASSTDNQNSIQRMEALQCYGALTVRALARHSLTR